MRGCCSGYATTALASSVVLVVPLLCTAAEAEPVRIRYRTPRTNYQACGVDSLYVCLHSMGRFDITLSSLEQRLPLGPKGITLEQLVTLCEEESVKTTVVRTTVPGLVACGGPMIVHVSESHYVSLLGVDDGRLVVFDNAVGLLDCTPAWFSSHYDSTEHAAVFFGDPSLYMLALSWGKEAAVMCCVVGLVCTLFLCRQRNVSRSLEAGTP